MSGKHLSTKVDVRDLLSGEPDKGDPHAIEDLASWLQTTCNDCADRSRFLLNDVLGGLRGMSGQVVDAIGSAVNEVARSWLELAAAFGGAAQAHRSHADELDSLCGEADSVAHAAVDAVEMAMRMRSVLAAAVPGVTAGRQGWRYPPPERAVPPDMQRTVRTWREAIEDFASAERRWAQLCDERERLDARFASALDEVDMPANLRRFAVSITGGATRSWAGDGLAGSVGAAVYAIALTADGTASGVRRVWDAMTDAQRAVLVQFAPQVVGNLDGVPIGWRAKANEVCTREEVATIEERMDRLEEAGNLNGEYNRLVETRNTYLYLLNSTHKVYDADGHEQIVVGIPVVVFDPKRSAIATYHGPLDADGDIPADIKNVVIHVPGTGTTLRNFDGSDSRGRLLHERANRADPGDSSTALFVWAGGQFPQDVQAASDSYSRDLGPRLRDFADTIDTSPGSSTLTVTGHSYGGAIVGMSESVGLKADRVVYVAAAGIGNDNVRVADFPHTGDKPHYALMARNDLLVGHSQGADLGSLGHGASPLKDPNVVRMETGYQKDGDPASGTIEDRGPSNSHSDVYMPGSTSFNNIVQAITGGRVSTYAPDTLRSDLTNDLQSPYIDGILREDYEPTYVDVK